VTSTEQRTLGDYEVHIAWEGFASIRQISSGEIMHSRTPPMEEAKKLYIEQSSLGERLRATSKDDCKQTGQVFMFGSSPKLVEHEQKSLDFVSN